MALDLTQNEVEAQITAAVNILETHRTDIEGSGNILELIDTYNKLAEGHLSGSSTAAMARFRRRMAGSLSRQTARAILDPLFLMYGRVLDFPERTAPGVIRRLYRYFIDNSESVHTRGFTFGSPSAGGSNVGDGVIRRLNVDAEAEDIEVGLAESFEAQCVRDQRQVGLHEEEFVFRSSWASHDGLEKLGTGQRKTIAAISADGGSIVENASFTNGTDASALTSWTINSGAANISFDTATVYRAGGAGDTTPKSLQLDGAFDAKQSLRTTGATITRSAPYLMQIVYNRSVGSGTGTLKFGVGSQTATVSTLSTSGAGWNILLMTLDSNLWYKNFRQDETLITLVLDSTSEAVGGTTYIDDCIVAPMTPFRGQFYAVVGGATTFAPLDKFTWSDTVTEKKIQYWIARTYGLYLPQSGTPTFPEPA